MRKLMGIGACVGFALLLVGCSEQTKKAKDVTAQARTDLDKAGKAVQETGAGAAKAVQEAGAGAAKAVQDAGAGASKAVQEAGAGAKKGIEAAGEAAAETRAKISAAASKASAALGEQYTKASEQVSKSLQSVKGGPELVQKLSDIIPTLQKTLATITDKESAQKALPKLEELDGMVSKLSGQFDLLPENAKKTVGALIQKGTGSLQPLVDSVLALPAVQAIRPKLEAIMAKLKGLNG
jgi:hypothetical protein